jgi:two-component system nitrate/nitrite response regulator NarL
MIRNDAGSTSIAGSTPNDTGNIDTFLHVNNALLRAGLSHILSGTCFRVVDDSEGVPALCLVEAHESSEHMLDTVRAIRNQHSLCKIALIGGQSDLAFVIAASSAGVDGFCSVTSSHQVLIKSLELIMLGEKVLPSAVVDTFLGQAPQAHSTIGDRAERETLDPRVSKLSPREAEILQSLMGGDPNKVIARKLDITEATIKVHVKAILRKIGVANRTQAAMWAAGNLANVAPASEIMSGGGPMN